ncbi:hypothetical protein WJX84_003845, partial [Apatococcus fuscideae]
MPITPSLTWDQTKDSVHIVIKLPGISQGQGQLDLQLTDSFLKVNRAPYLRFVDFYGLVVDSKSSAVVSGGFIEFTLKKADTGEWRQLEADLPKEEVVKRRRVAVENQQAAQQATRKSRQEEQKLQERKVIDQRMELAQKKRDLIQKAKDEELSKERASLNNWQISAAAPPGVKQGNGGAMPDHPHCFGRGWQPAAASHAAAPPSALQQAGDPEQSCAGNSGDAAGPVHEEANDDPMSLQEWEHWPDASAAEPRADSSSLGKENGSQASPPEEMLQRRAPPRRALQPVQVEFTELESPSLPARATRELELKEYKRQIKEGQSAKADEDALDVRQTQPLFMKDKGDGLARSGNHAGALNAYTRALTLDPTLTAALSNRSSCHLALRNHRECIQDCTAALEQLGLAEPGEGPDGAGAGRARQQAKLHTRRASAHLALSNSAAALEDLQQAVRLQPADAALERDLARLEAAERPTDLDAVRHAALACCKCQDWEGAVKGFTSLLDLQRPEDSAERIGALANRSAAHLAPAMPPHVLLDCTTALTLLLSPVVPPDEASDKKRDTQQGAETGSCLDTYHATGRVTCDCEALQVWQRANPGKGSETLIRLLARRGAALGHLH